MKRVILGTGPVGMATMEAEVLRGHEVVLVNRSGLVREVLPPGVRVQGLDARNATELEALAQGADVIYHCASGDLSALMDAAIQAASGTGAILVYADNLLAYGDAGGIPISEISPELAGFPAAEERKVLGRRLADAQYAGKLKAIIARSPDAYGPRVLKGPLGRQVFTRILRNEEALVPGRLDIPHAYIYIKDLGKNLSILGDSPEAAGKVWHIPSSPAVTQQQFFDIVRDMVSRNVQIRTFGGKTGLAALFSSVPKEWKDLMYQFEKPFMCNHTRFATTWGERCTPHTQALWETLEWYRRHGLED